jgi:hypothetical protein
LHDPSPEEVETWQDAQQQLGEIYQSEETYWSTKVKELKATSSRQKKNHIGQMEINGLSSDPVAIRQHVQVFYHQLFNSEGPRIGQISPSVWSENEKTQQQKENVALITPFSEEEIREALFQMNGAKAPEPDGFPILFYQHY